jgi:type II secretory ATPase GspE/PulE/Tfp pilus assembly ATPase PilB-like protein
VLSTLHTSSAAGTLPRLTDMGVESFMLSSTANVIISQRLVRKVCQECKEEYSINEETYKSYSENFDTGLISKILVNEKVVTGKFKNDKELWMSIRFVKGRGCTKCRNEGYKGRAGIFEVLANTDSIAKLINSNATSDIIENQSRAEGMNTMMEDGLVKAVKGITTIEEVMRVTKE